MSGLHRTDGPGQEKRMMKDENARKLLTEIIPDPGYVRECRNIIFPLLEESTREAAGLYETFWRQLEEAMRNYRGRGKHGLLRIQ